MTKFQFAVTGECCPKSFYMVWLSYGRFAHSDVAQRPTFKIFWTLCARHIRSAEGWLAALWFTQCVRSRLVSIVSRRILVPFSFQITGTHCTTRHNVLTSVSSSRPPLLCPWLAEKITMKCFPSSKHSKHQQNFWPQRKQHWCHPDGSLPDADIRLELGVEPILLSVETTQLRWFVHVLRMYTNRMARWICTSRTTMDTVERPTDRTGRIQVAQDDIQSQAEDRMGSKDLFTYSATLMD